MTKLQYLLRFPAARPARDVRDWALGELGPRLLAAGPARLKLTLTGEDPPRLSLVPYRRRRLVLVSVWDDSGVDEAARWPALLPGEADAGYRVRESLPRRYRRDWADGVETPGLGLLTLFRRRAGLADEEFLRRWHDEHSVIALDVHPLWSYVRNVVEAAALPGSPPLDGIVEEHFRDRRELLHPAVLFGGWWRMAPNMVRVLVDVRRFLDLATIENYLVSEHWLRG